MTLDIWMGLIRANSVDPYQTAPSRMSVFRTIQQGADALLHGALLERKHHIRIELQIPPTHLKLVLGCESSTCLYYNINIDKAYGDKLE